MLLSLASWALSSCGGEPIDYDSNVVSTVFVWRQNAFAEHPGVAQENDPGMPASTRKALIGKTLTVNFTVNAVPYQMAISFLSQTRCVIRTDVRIAANGVMTTFNGTYTYEIDNAAGTEATLTFSFDDNLFWSNTCEMKLVFPTNAMSCTATFTQFVNGLGQIIVPAGTQVPNSPWTLTP